MKNRYPNFDLLRLLLAVEVVVAHVLYWATPSYDWYAYVSAVPCFLAISGFLVLKSYAESNSARLFWRKRALRILPALVVSLLLYAVLFNWFSVYNSMLNWLTGGLYTLPGNANGPLWSLAWEEAAYACLALLWMAGAYRRPIFIWLLLAAALAAVWLTQGASPHVQTIVLLAPTFLIGNLMYLHRERMLRVNGVVPWIILGLVIWGRGLPIVGPVIQLSPPVFEAWAVVWVGMAGWPLLRWRFPDLSYGVYIFHMPLITYLIVQKGPLTSQQLALWLPLPLLLTCLLSWYAVEAPALRLKRRHRVDPGAVGDAQTSA